MKSLSILCDFAVASFADVWIKTDNLFFPFDAKNRHILRGCVALLHSTENFRSAAGFPLTKRASTPLLFIVVLVSVWIKIVDMQYPFSRSYPSRIRGLKSMPLLSSD